MHYPKIGLEVNLGGGEGRGEGLLWLGGKGGGKSLIATYPENFVLIYQLEVWRGGGGQEGGYLEDIEGS